MKNKKQIIQIVSLILILIVLFISYKVIKNHTKEQSTETTNSSLAPIVSLSDSDITEIEYTNNTSTYNFINKYGTWYYSTDETFDVSESYISALLSSVSNITPLREIETSLNNEDEYGLDTPSIL